MSFLPFPFNLAFGFIGKNWKLVLVLALFAFIASAAGCHMAADARGKRDLADARVMIQNLQTDLRQAKANEAALQAGITTQNAAVSRLKADGDARAAAATKAAQDALKARKQSDSLAAQLTAYKSAATCPAREAGIAELVKGLKR